MVLPSRGLKNIGAQLMKKKTLVRLAVVAIASALVVPAGIVPATSAPADIKVGVITSQTGALKSYGDAYVAGLEWGLKYFTKGTMKVDGAKIVLTKKDDGVPAGGDPAAATAFFKDMVANGTKIVVGTASSAVGATLAPLAQQNKVLYISGPAKADAITSATNKYVFRSGNTSIQDFAPLAALPRLNGKRITILVEDNTFGLGNLLAAKAVLAPKGAVLTEIKASTTTTEFTPVAKQILDSNAAYVFIAWANPATAVTLLTTLKQQGVWKNSIPVTALAGVATYDFYGALLDGQNALLTNSYFPGVANTSVAAALASDYEKAGQTQDLFTPDGVNAAQMIIRAIKGNSGMNVDKAITNLEGYSFIGLKGQITVDATKHILVQPMYFVTLVKSGSHYTPKLLRVLQKVTA
jgi:branched-chain amino acid transport system substrate-binding protein